MRPAGIFNFAMGSFWGKTFIPAAFSRANQSDPHSGDFPDPVQFCIYDNAYSIFTVRLSSLTWKWTVSMNTIPYLRSNGCFVISWRETEIITTTAPEYDMILSSE